MLVSFEEENTVCNMKFNFKWKPVFKKKIFQVGILPLLHLLPANPTDEGRLPRRLVTDQQNPFTAYSEKEFIHQYCLSKECIHTLLDQVEPHLPRYKIDEVKYCLIPCFFFLSFSS